MVQINIQVVDPADDQIHTNELECETLAFSKEFSTDQFHFNFKREKLITLLKYIHSRIKNWDTKDAENPQCLFCCLDWLEKEVVNSTRNFIIQNHFQSGISVGRLKNIDTLRN